jgi:glycosyltransferase involved in cell wall biosynthesis
MTVIFLARNLVVGGAERALLNIINRADGFSPVLALLQKTGRLLADLDPEVRVVDLSTGGAKPSATGPSAPESGQVDPRGDDDRVEAGPIALLTGARRLKRLAVTTNADVVSSFLMRSHVVALVAKIAFRMPARVVLNVHVHVTQSAPYLYPSPAKRWLMTRIVRWMFPRAERILVVADAVKDDLVRCHGIPESKILVVRNAMDLAAISAGARERPQLPEQFADRPLIVAAGRLVQLKGYDLLIRALAQLDTVPSPVLVILGDGVELDNLRRLAAECRVEDRVLFAGYAANPWKYMADADVLALPSRTEAFPNVLGEALALEVPIVASRCSPGVSEYLQDGDLGILVEPENVGDLRDGLAEALENGKAHALAEPRGSQRVAEFDVARAVPAYAAALGIVTAGDRTS